MDSPIKADPSYSSSIHGYFTLEQQTGTLKTISRDHVLTKGRKEKPDIRKIADHVMQHIDSCTLDQLHLIKDSFEKNRYKHSWAWFAKIINKNDDVRIIEGLSRAISEKTGQPRGNATQDLERQEPQKPPLETNLDSEPSQQTSEALPASAADASQNSQDSPPTLEAHVKPTPEATVSISEKSFLEATSQFTQVQQLISKIARTIPQFGPLVESNYKEAIEKFNNLLKYLQKTRTKEELEEAIPVIENWTLDWKTTADYLEQVSQRAELLNKELLSAFPYPAICEKFSVGSWEVLLNDCYDEPDVTCFLENADITLTYELDHLPTSFKKKCKEIQPPQEKTLPKCRDALNRLNEFSSTWKFLSQNLGPLGEPFSSLLTSAEEGFYDFEKKASLRLPEMSLQQLEQAISVLRPRTNLFMHHLLTNLEKRKDILEEVNSLLPSFREDPIKTKLLEFKERINLGVSDEGLDAIHSEIINIMQEHQSNIQESEQALAQEYLSRTKKKPSQ